MRQLHLSLLFPTLLGMLIGCSSSSGKKGNTDANNQVVVAQSKEEALTNLAPEQIQSFENWKSQLVKTCDPSQAFGLEKQTKLEEQGVDGAVLLGKNSYSAMFSDGSSFAQLANYNSLAGTSSSKIERRETFNGRAFSLAAETKRTGSTCEVFLFGQKVFETYLVKNFVVGAHWDPVKEVSISSELPRIKTLGTSGMAELRQDRIYDLVSQSLRPTVAAIRLIAIKLELNTEQANQFFILSTTPVEDTAVKVISSSSELWNNRASGEVLAPAARLNQVFGSLDQALPLELRLSNPKFSFNDVQNSSDRGNYKLNLTLHLAALQNAKISYQTGAMELAGLVAYDQEEALQCVKARALAYENDAQVAQIQPSVGRMLGPCLSLFHELEKTSRYNELLKSLVPQKFAGVTASPQFQYQGWDLVLGRLALEVFHQGKDLREELDPTSQSAIVASMAKYLDLLQMAMNGAQNMQEAKDAVLQMGLNWSFKNDAVTQNRIQQILQAVDNTIGVFRVSSEHLLSSLALQPNSQDDILSFALSIDQSYKTEILNARSLAKDLNYKEFEISTFEMILQKKLSLADCQAWTRTLKDISLAIQEFPNIGPVKNDLVGLSVKWLKSNELQAFDLKTIYQSLSNVIEPFPASTNALMQSLVQSLVGSKADLDFARSLTPEYKLLATTVVNQANAVDFQSWGQSLDEGILQKQPSLQQLKAWNESWSAVQAFIQREKQKVQGTEVSRAERNRRDVVELAVSATWSTIEFSSLESIAELAKAKNTCERYLDASSLADCVGLGLFSKNKSKFFDPSLVSRYAPLAQDFVGYVKLIGPDATLLRWTLVDAFFDSSEVIWSNCSQEAFSQKARSLQTAVNSLIKESDQFKKWEIERQLKESLENCR